MKNFMHFCIVWDTFKTVLADHETSRFKVFLRNCIQSFLGLAYCIPYWSYSLDHGVKAQGVPIFNPISQKQKSCSWKEF